MKHHTSPTLVGDRHDASRPTTLYEGLPSKLLTRPTVVIEDQLVCKELTDSATGAITCSATRTSSPSAWHRLLIQVGIATELGC